jgi:uncharacterized damage-inducible protein DinB
MTAQPGFSPDFAAGYCHMMLDGVTRELEITKKVLAAIPDAGKDYRHDPNGRTAWELAWHLANTDVQFLDGIADLEFKMESPDAEHKPKSVAELVDWYDRNFKRAAARVAALSPEQLLTPVEFFGVFNFPAVLYLGFLNNHSIHHRGALATYLRPMGAKVPSIYGGSYDEPFQPAQTEPQTAAA